MGYRYRVWGVRYEVWGIKKLDNWLWAIGDYCFEKNGKI